MKIRIFCISLLLTLFTGAVNAKEFHITWSGWSGDRSESDTNGDMEGGGYNHLMGTGTLGKTDSAGTFDNLPWDGNSFCAHNDSGQPDGILFYTLSSTEVSRAANGDLLYRTLASSPSSTVCFNCVTSVATVNSYYQITGGTGRFEGASGETESELIVDVRQGINGVRGTERGKIRLSRPYPGKHRN